MSNETAKAGPDDPGCIKFPPGAPLISLRSQIPQTIDSATDDGLQKGSSSQQHVSGNSLTKTSCNHMGCCAPKQLLCWHTFVTTG